MTEPLNPVKNTKAYKRGEEDAKAGRPPSEGLADYLYGYGNVRGFVVNESWVYKEEETP